jgi:coatomer protein complex subunit alpha (xenin)
MPAPAQAETWGQTATVAGQHVAAGNFEAGLRLLRNQIGVSNFAAPRAAVLATASASHAFVPGIPGLASVRIPLHANSNEEAFTAAASRPCVSVTMASLVESLKAVYRAFQGGKFAEAQVILRSMHARLPLVVVSNKAEAKEVKELLKIVTQYALAVHLEVTRKNTPTDSPAALGRQVELAALMTHCELQPAHTLLALNLAMTLAYKAKNFIHAASFARRVCDMPEATNPKHAALVTKAKKVLVVSQQQGRNAMDIDYDERNPFVICAGSLKPVFRGSPSVTAPYSGAHYKPEFAGSVCVLDGMSKVGEDTVGLIVMQES